MVFDIGWLIEAWEDLPEPNIQDRIIALGLLLAEAEAEVEEVKP